MRPSLALTLPPIASHTLELGFHPFCSNKLQFCLEIARERGFVDAEDYKRAKARFYTTPNAEATTKTKAVSALPSVSAKGAKSPAAADEAAGGGGGGRTQAMLESSGPMPRTTAGEQKVFKALPMSVEKRVGKRSYFL